MFSRCAETNGMGGVADQETTKNSRNLLETGEWLDIVGTLGGSIPGLERRWPTITARRRAAQSRPSGRCRENARPSAAAACRGLVERRLRAGEPHWGANPSSRSSRRGLAYARGAKLSGLAGNEIVRSNPRRNTCGAPLRVARIPASSRCSPCNRVLRPRSSPAPRGCFHRPPGRILPRRPRPPAALPPAGRRCPRRR